MNGYERVMSAFAGRKADKVPILLHNFMMAAKEAGYSQGRYREDPRIIAECLLRSVDEYEFDGICVDIDTVTLAGAVGVPVDLPYDAPGRSHKGCLSSLGEIPDPGDIDILSYRYIGIWLEAVRILKDRLKGEIAVRGNCDQAPFSLASSMRTPSVWMMDLMDPDSGIPAENLLGFCTTIAREFTGLMIEAGADIVSAGDSPAGPSMISPDMYRTFAIPFENRVAELAEASDIPYILHICGNTDLILEALQESRAAGIELDYLTSVDRIFERFSRDKVFLGNIDPTGVLLQGTEEDVERATDELLSIYGDSPRFILNAGCAIAPDTPSGNLKAMIRTARSWSG